MANCAILMAAFHRTLAATGPRLGLRLCVWMATALGAIVLAPQAASAGASMSVGSYVPSEAVVGDQNIAGSVSLTNHNFGDQVGLTVCKAGDSAPPCAGSKGITIFLSCAAVGVYSCVTPDAGVYSFNSTATGRPSTACAGTRFAVSLVDAGTGEVALSPQPGHVVLPAPGDTCVIDFTVNVQRLPNSDASTMPGWQTIHFARADATASPQLSGSGSGGGDTTVKARPIIAATPSPGIQLGDAVWDSVTLDDLSTPATGSVAFKLFGPSDHACTGAPVHSEDVPISAGGTAASSSFTPATPGTYRWVPSFSGDDANTPATGLCSLANAVSVSAAAPAASLTTSPAGPCIDCDGDGFPSIVDCNDGDRNVHPGMRDVPGNKLDEDCSGDDAAYPRLESTIHYELDRYRPFTHFVALDVRRAPAGSTIRLSCRGRGCGFKTQRREVKRYASTVDLTPLVRRAKLRPGAQLELRITQPSAIGTGRRWIVRRGVKPRFLEFCLGPGVTPPTSCPQ